MNKFFYFFSILLCAPFLAVSQSPGGVSSNLSLWLKANAETFSTPPTLATDGDRITDWYDQSGSLNHVSQSTNIIRPRYRNNSSNNINYNPVVDFQPFTLFIPLGNRLEDSDGILGTATYSDFNVYAVVITEDVLNSVLFRELCNPTALKVHPPFGNDDWYWDVGNTSNNRVNGNWAGTVGTPYLWSHLFSTTSGRTIVGQRQAIEKNGEVIISDNASKSNMTGTGDLFSLGGQPFGSYMDGQIAEFAIYAGAIDADEHKQIESYLAIKYAITLDNSGGGTDGDYIASDGTTTPWDASDNADYHNDIIVIGRDDDSDLLQKQSHQLDDSLRVFIDVLAADNDSNAGTISNNNSFIAIGHNGAKQRAQDLEKPVGIKARFGRVWKVVNTSFDDEFSLEIEWDSNNSGGFDINQIRLLSDDDGNFSDAEVLSTTDGLTFTEGTGTIIVGNLVSSAIANGETKFITIGSVSWGTPLPIELISFQAKVTEKQSVELIWQTASEINNDFFTIERSKDASTWHAVQTIDGAGNSTEKLSYSAEDARPYSGMSYYRLKQTDFDGKFSYSDIEVVSVGQLEENALKIYPNPSKDLMTIEANKVELLDFAVYNLYGQNVMDLLKITEQNVSTITLDISQLADGIYTLKTKTHTRKIIKQ